MPDHIALSSAESEYNMACLAFMAAMHLIILKNDLELGKNDAHLNNAVPIYMDSTSAIAVGQSFRDTKHTHHFFAQISLCEELCCSW